MYIYPYYVMYISYKSWTLRHNIFYRLSASFLGPVGILAKRQRYNVTRGNFIFMRLRTYNNIKTVL